VLAFGRVATFVIFLLFVVFEIYTYMIKFACFGTSVPFVLAFVASAWFLYTGCTRSSRSWP
jgi:hypothetical protein